MHCPKCGAEQDPTRQECSDCGIVFARYQPNQVRRPTLAQTPVEQPEETPKKIPVPLVIVGVFFVIVFGLIWTKHSREQRAKANADDILNDINNKGAVLREDLRKSQESIARARARAAMTAAAVNSQESPADLDSERIKSIIEQCGYFSEVVTVDIPKRFQENIYGFTVEDYPAFPMAAIDHLIEIDPPFNVSGASKYRDPANPGTAHNVKVLNDAYSKADVHEDTTVYHFGLGRRRVEIVKIIPTSQTNVNLVFRWDFDQTAGARLSPEREDRNGGAAMRREAGVWAIQSIWRNVHDGSVGLNCH